MPRPLWHELTPRGVQWGHYTHPTSGPRTFRGLGIVDAQGGVVTSYGVPWDESNVSMIPWNTNPAPAPGSGPYGGGAALQAFVSATQNAINPAPPTPPVSPLENYSGIILLALAAYIAMGKNII